MSTRKVFYMAFAAAVLILSGTDSFAGSLAITQRESSASNIMWAGSAGASQSSNESDSTNALTGPFSFSDTNSVAVTPADPFSGGAASASGAMSVADNVVQSSSGLLSVTATRAASGIAMYGSGTGNAFSYQNQYLRVRFTVNGDDAMFTLVGAFDPGFTPPGIVVGEAYTVRLYRPFTSNVLVDVDSAETLNENGLLLAGLTYELEIALNDRNSANAGNPLQSDASSFDLQFNVVSVPEPSTAILAGFGAIFCFVLRTRRKRT